MSARVAMLGGAFDPPHRAHVALAEAAVAQLNLDAIHIVPTGQAWHKARVLSDAPHRLAMAREAFAHQAKAIVDDCEVLREGPSYSADTLHALRVRHPHAALFLVIGADQWHSFPNWARQDEILALAQLVVAQRPEAASLGHQPATEPAHLNLSFDADPISSSLLRTQLADPARRDAALATLPEGVASYIAHHQLYWNQPNS